MHEREGAAVGGDADIHGIEEVGGARGDLLRALLAGCEDAGGAARDFGGEAWQSKPEGGEFAPEVRWSGRCGLLQRSDGRAASWRLCSK